VEYNGEQHYTTGHFSMSREDLVKMVRRDRYKEQVCKEVGVDLIVVPYTVSGYANIARYINKRLPGAPQDGHSLDAGCAYMPPVSYTLYAGL